MDRDAYNVLVHWLTWHQIGQLLQSWQGVLAAGFALLGTAYYGPRKMLETWDWYIARIGHDDPVWAVVREPKYKPQSSQNNFTTYTKIELPYTAKEIGDRIRRKESSVTRSLKRLEKRNKVKDVHGGWLRT